MKEYLDRSCGYDMNMNILESEPKFEYTQEREAKIQPVKGRWQVFLYMPNKLRRELVKKVAVMKRRTKVKTSGKVRDGSKGKRRKRRLNKKFWSKRRVHWDEFITGSMYEGLREEWCLNITVVLPIIPERRQTHLEGAKLLACWKKYFIKYITNRTGLY